MITCHLVIIQPGLFNSTYLLHRTGIKTFILLGVWNMPLIPELRKQRQWISEFSGSQGYTEKKQTNKRHCFLYYALKKCAGTGGAGVSVDTAQHLIHSPENQ